MRVRERDFIFPIITTQYDYMAVKTSNVESLLKEQLETKFLKTQKIFFTQTGFKLWIFSSKSLCKKFMDWKNYG